MKQKSFSLASHPLYGSPVALLALNCKSVEARAVGIGEYLVANLEEEKTVAVKREKGHNND